LIAGLMAVSVRPSGRPASGRRCRVATPWRPYAGVGPTGQVIADTSTPRAHQLVYLLRRARLASSVHAEPSRQPLRHCRSCFAVAELANHRKSATAISPATPP